MKIVQHGFVKSAALLLSCVVISNPILAKTPDDLGLNITKIEKLTGMKGRLDSKEQTYRINAPRDDLKINANGVQITPAMGLTSWVVFKKVDKQTLMLGELVLTPDQVNPVLDVALNHGIHVTSLHNNYMWENPQVVFMHIESTGKEEHLADIAGKLLATIKSTSDGKGDLPLAMISPTNTTLDPARLNTILGVKGILKDGVYKVIIGKTAETDDYPIGSSMGLNTWAAFVGSNAEAVVNGDIVTAQSDLQKVLISLHKAGIYVVGIQDQAADSEPKFVSVHFWGVGNTKNLAKGIRTTLDKEQDNTD